MKVTSESEMTVPLGTVAEVRLGRQRSPDRASGPNMTPYMRAANVGWDGLRLDDVKEMDFSPGEQETYGLREGDILVGEASGSRDEVGKSAIWRGEVPGACFQNTLIRVRVDPARALPAFVRAHLLHDARRGALADASRGVGIHHLGRETIAGWPVFLPPLADQHRIVAHLDACFARTKRAKTALDEVPALLDRLRQSILAAAFRGDLTADWRAENPDVEPASELLKRIRVERRRRWEEAELAKMIAKGKPPKDDRWKAKYVEPEPVDASELPELPEGWCWATIEQVADVGTGATPKRGLDRFWIGGTVPWVTSGAVNEAFVRAPTEFTTEVALRETNLRVYPIGTLLVAMYGEGRTRGMCSELAIPAATNQALAAIQLEVSAVLVRALLKRYLEFVYEQTRAVAAGGVQPNLNLEIIRGIRFPCPPVAEIDALVFAIERACRRSTRIEQIVSAASAANTTLEAAILGSAFSADGIVARTEATTRNVTTAGATPAP